MTKKYIALLLICTLLGIGNLSAQDATNYTADFQNTSLKEALKYFEKEYGYYFSYNDDLVTDKKLSIQINTPLIEKALTQILAGTYIEFEILDGQFIALKELVEQEHLLKGTITDESGLPLAYAAIVSTKKNAYVVSDIDGQFSIPVTEGDTLFCKYLGFESQLIHVDERLIGRQFSVSLKQIAHELIELLVEEQLNEVAALASKGSSAYEVVGTGISNSATAQIENTFYAVNLLPGVSASGYSSSLSIRGGSTDQSMTLIDGSTLYQLDHYYGLQNLINPELIQSATLYKGGYDSQFGGRVSGILDVKLKDPPMDYVEGGVGISFLDVEGYLSVPIVKNKLATYVAYRKFHGFLNEYLYDKIKSPSNEINNQNDQSASVFKRTINPSIKYHDWNSKLLWKINEFNTLSSSLIISKDSYSSSYDLLEGRELGPRIIRLLDILGNPEFINSQDKVWGNLALNLQWSINKEKWKSTNSFHSSNYYKDFKQIEHYRDTTRILPQPLELVERETLKENTLKSDHTIKLNQNTSLFTGLTFKNYKLKRHAFPEASFDQQLNDADTANLLGLYGQINYLTPSDFELKLGGRLWLYGPTNKAYFSPRLALNYNGWKDSGWYLKFATGRYFQFLHQLTDAFTYDAYWIMSNGNQIAVLSSDHYIAGFTYSKSKHKFDTEFYFKNTQGDISDLSYRNPFFITALQGSGSSYGFDSFYEWQGEHFYHYFAYAFNQSIKRYGPEQTEKKRMQTVQLASMYHRKHFKIGLTWELRQVDYRFEGWGGFSDYPKLQYYLLEPFAAPLYHRLDLSTQYDFKLTAKTKGILALTIYDLYNQKNVEERIIQEGPAITDNQQLEYILTDVSQLGLLPNISFKVIF